MPERPLESLDRLAIAHRILVAEGVLDAFGHVSLRDPVDADVFWLSAARPPSRVTPADFLAFSLDGEPIAPTDRPLFSERFIHAAIYAARADVHSVCHHHARSLMPFCLVDRPLAAMSQTGAFLGAGVPVWDSAAAFGATRMLVENAPQAESLARALGLASLVLMRGHGATVAGRSIEDVVFKAVHACRDADALLAASALGTPKGLSADEIALAGEPAGPALERAWAHWTSFMEGPST